MSTQLLEMLVLVSVLWYGGHLVLTDRLQGKNLVSFMLYQLQMGDNLTYMGYVWTGLMQAVGASRKVFDYIDRRPAIDTSLGRVLALPRELDASLPAIQFDQVHFSYPSRPDAPVLRGISFSVAAGETVALVGPSGGGKSSCIALLQHFYEPSAGCVLLHGVPIADYEHRALHSLVSLVSQEPVLYGRAIHENIVYGLDEQFDAAVDDPVDVEDSEKRRAFDASVSPFCERVLHAPQLANAHNFIEQQPSGYLTQVGEKGTQMSGGQKQRIAIARALIRSPRVVLLDEATSALDAESEHLVQQAIYSNLSGRTVLLIAHRLSTVERADRIVVVDHGLVVQQGTHKQLLQQDGLYKQLVHRQLLGGHDVIAVTTSSANVAGLGAAAAVDVTKHLPSPVRSTGSYKSFGSASPLSASPSR